MVILPLSYESLVLLEGYDLRTLHSIAHTKPFLLFGGPRVKLEKWADQLEESTTSENPTTA